MGADSALQLCSRLLFLIALGRGAVIKLNGVRDGNSNVLPDDICPCITRTECPRVFGSVPGDELLGSFRPCGDPESVRCCGISAGTSVEHLVSGNVSNPTVYGVGDFVENKETAGEVRVSHPGRVVLVPFEVPGYTDRVKSPASPVQEEEVEDSEDYVSYENESEEAVTEGKRDAAEDQRELSESEKVISGRKYTDVVGGQGELNPSKIVKGENIDGSVSQTDAFVSPDYLDYRGVNKYGIKGGVQTIIGNEQRGKISSSKRVESTSSSSSVKKTESIVTSESNASSSNVARGLETPAELPEEEKEELFVLGKVKEPKIIALELTDSNTLNEKGEEVVRKNFELRQGRTHLQDSIASEDVDSIKDDYYLKKIGHVSSQPDLDGSSTTGATSGLRNDRFDQLKTDSKDETVFQNRQETLSQKKSETVTKESSDFEESSSSRVIVTNERQEDLGTSDRIAGNKMLATTNQDLEQPINTIDKTNYGSLSQVSEQQRSESVVKESTNAEESSFSNVESVALTTEEQRNVGKNVNIDGGKRKPQKEASLGSRGRAIYSSQRKEASSQQQSKSVKKESSNFEENTSSNVQSTTTNTEDQLDQDSRSKILVTTWRPVLKDRRQLSNRGRTVYGQRKETDSFRQQSESVNKEFSIVEKNTSSNDQSIATNNGDLYDNDSNSDLVVTTSRSIPKHGRLAANRGNVVYGQRKKTNSSQQQSKSVKKESSTFEENTSLNDQRIATITKDLSDDDLSSDLLTTTLHSVSDHKEKETNTAQQKSESVKKESSTFEENTSSIDQSIATITEDLSDDDLSSDLRTTTSRSVLNRRRLATNRGNIVYGHRKETNSAQQKSESVKKESSTFEENTSSNDQSIATITEDLSDDDLSSDLRTTTLRSVSNRRRLATSRGNVVYGQRKETNSAQQKSESVKKESSTFEENTSLNDERIATITKDLSDYDLSSDLLTTTLRSVSDRKQKKTDSAQHKSESVKKESSIFEENTSSNDQSIVTITEDLSNDDSSSDLLTTTLRSVSDRRRLATSRGNEVYGQQEETNSAQQESESVKKESSTFEENTSLNDQRIATITTDLSDDDLSSDLLTTTLHSVSDHKQTETKSAQRKSESVKEESSTFEENTSSNDQSIATITEDLSDDDLSSDLRTTTLRSVLNRRRLAINRGNIVYGQRKETNSAQQKSESVKKESSTFEENTSSKDQSIATITEDLSDDDLSSDLLTTTLRSVSDRRRPATSRGNVVYGQRKETNSAQLKSESVKKESSTFEENTSSNDQSIATITEDLSDDDLSSDLLTTTLRSVSDRRKIATSRGNVVYGQRKETNSAQQKSESVKNESSTFEENTSLNDQRIATITRDLSDYDSSSDLLATTLRSVPDRRRLATNRGNVVHGQRKKTNSAQLKSESVKKESSTFEENTSSNNQRIAAITKNSSDDNLSSDLLTTTSHSVPDHRGLTSSRSDIVYKQQEEINSSHQESESVKKESSTVEENTSSNLRNIDTDNEHILDNNTNSEHLATSNRGNSVYVQRKETNSSEQQNKSVKKESSTLEENTSSIDQRIATITEDLSNHDSSSQLLKTTSRLLPYRERPTPNRVNGVHGQRSGTNSFQQQSKSVNKQSTSLETNKSSNVESITKNTSELSHNDAGSEFLDAGSDGKAVFGQHGKSSGRKESRIVTNKSSSITEDTSSNDETMFSNTEKLSLDDVNGQHEQITSTEEKNKTIKENSSSRVNNTSSVVNQVTIADETTLSNESNVDINMEVLSSINNQRTIADSIVDTAVKQQTKTSTEQKKKMVLSEGSSVMQKSTTSNEWNLVSGKPIPGGEVVLDPAGTGKINNADRYSNQEDNFHEWQIANRSYVPVLVNAGFLRDRATATGALGLDPLSGVTHSDIWDPTLAAELLPLSCGNVVFGERSKNGKTLVCDIPKNRVSPIQILGVNMKSVNPEKLNGPVLLGAIAPDEAKMQNDLQSSPKRRFHHRRPVQINAAEDSREEEAGEIPRPTQKLYRGTIRHSILGRRAVPEVYKISNVEKNAEEVESRQFSKDTVSTSSSTSKKTSSTQESIILPNSNKEIITKSEFDISSAEEYDAERETEKRNSKFLLLSPTPISSQQQESSPEATEDRTTDSGESNEPKIVEVVEEAPVTHTKFNAKRLRNSSSGNKLPAKELEVVNIKTSQNNGGNVEEVEIVGLADNSRRPTFFYNRNSREVKEFAPGEKEVTISPEQLSMSGRINVIGPLPAGFKDPVLSSEEELDIDLPGSFRPSQPDPIHWP